MAAQGNDLWENVTDPWTLGSNPWKSKFSYALLELAARTGLTYGYTYYQVENVQLGGQVSVEASSALSGGNVIDVGALAGVTPSSNLRGWNVISVSAGSGLDTSTVSMWNTSLSLGSIGDITGSKQFVLDREVSVGCSASVTSSSERHIPREISIGCEAMVEDVSVAGVNYYTVEFSGVTEYTIYTPNWGREVSALGVWVPQPPLKNW